MELHFDSPLEGDYDFLVENLRQADRREFACLYPGVELKLLVREAARASGDATVAYRDGIPFCIFGCGTTAYGGMPWMAGTDDIEQMPLTVLRRVKAQVDAWLTTHKVLFNYVHRDNLASQRMLQWLGFQISRAPEHSIHPECFFFWRTE